MWRSSTIASRLVDSITDSASETSSGRTAVHDCDAGLDRDQTHAVGNDVVQFAGDPQPFVRHRLLGQGRAACDRGSPPVSDDTSQHPGAVQPGQAGRVRARQTPRASPVIRA